MIIKRKIYKILEVQNVEYAVSQYFGKSVKVSQMDVHMYDWIPNKMVYFEIFAPSVDMYRSCCSFEIQEEMHMWKGVRLDELYLDKKYIFNFSTRKFHTFSRKDKYDCP